MADNPAGGVLAPNPDEVSLVDLDDFLELEPDPSQQNTSKVVNMPSADRMAIVGIFVDDSGSMSGLSRSVIDGLNTSVEAFKGAKGSDFLLDVYGFCGRYYDGMLKDIPDDAFRRYSPDYNSTPLISHSVEQLNRIREKAKQYRNMGIPTTVALLIITDGLPNYESMEPKEFGGHVEPGDYIVGMGVAHPGSDTGVMEFRDLFKEMGIEDVVTPNSDPADIRHAINQFSMSVASIAGS
jgi:hypothetical protein